MSDATDATVRLDVALSGGAALGAYQAGAMAGLLVAVERLRDEDPALVTIDAVGGASAGALVSLLAATSHLAGLDPVATLHTAWVERVDLPLLLDQAGPAPLGSEELRDRLAAFVTDAEPVRTPSATDPVAMQVALSGLRGLTYRVDGLRGPGSIPATTHADWTRRALAPGLDRGELFRDDATGIGDAALASAANPGVFPARLVDRSPDAEHYTANGIVDMPEHARLWFTDGGLMQAEPLGHVLAAAADLHGDAPGRTVALLVDPRSEGPTTARRFGDPEHVPTWLGALARSMAVLSTQALYDDVRRVQRDNERLAAVDRLVELLGPALADHDDLRATLVDEVAAHTELDDPPHDPAMLLRAALGRAAGVAGKRPVDVDVLTPLLLEQDDDGIESLLAGEMLGDMGGFLDRDLRHSDFVLGYATTLHWLGDALPAMGLADEHVDLALAAVRAAHEHDWRAVNRGGAEVADLPARSRLWLTRLAGSAVRSIGTEALDALRGGDDEGDDDGRLAAAADALRAAAGRAAAAVRR